MHAVPFRNRKEPDNRPQRPEAVYLLPQLDRALDLVPKH